MSRLTEYFRRRRALKLRQPYALSQGGEGDIDRIVWDEFFAGRSDSGVMVEVGAAGPNFLSIGALYRLKGWRVISVEPNPTFAEQHRQQGHEVLEYACSDRDADDVDFVVVGKMAASNETGAVSFESFSSLGMQGKYAKLFDQHKPPSRIIKVQVRTLDFVLSTKDVRQVDLLSVDVEGWELAVMRGLTKCNSENRHS